MIKEFPSSEVKVVGEIRNKGPHHGENISLYPDIDSIRWSVIDRLRSPKFKFKGIIVKEGKGPDTVNIFYSARLNESDLTRVQSFTVNDVRQVLDAEKANPGKVKRWLTEKGFGGLFEPADALQGGVKSPGGGRAKEKTQFGGYITKVIHRPEGL